MDLREYLYFYGTVKLEAARVPINLNMRIFFINFWMEWPSLIVEG